MAQNQHNRDLRPSKGASIQFLREANKGNDGDFTGAGFCARLVGSLNGDCRSNRDIERLRSQKDLRSLWLLLFECSAFGHQILARNSGERHSGAPG